MKIITFVLSLLFLTAAFHSHALAGITLDGQDATQEITYYTEDFILNGEAGFDPIFNHSFDAEMYPPTTQGDPGWIFIDNDLSNVGLFLGAGATDTITFNLTNNQIVTYVKVVPYYQQGLGPHDLVRFFGKTATWESSSDDFGLLFLEATSEQLGSIEQIQLYSTQGAFKEVIIGVIEVPEPTTICLLCSLLASCFWKKLPQP